MKRAPRPNALARRAKGPDRTVAGRRVNWAGMDLLVGLCPANSGAGRRLGAHTVRLGNARMVRPLNGAVIASCSESARPSPNPRYMQRL